MKWGWVIFWVLVILFVINQPQAAAHVTHNIWGGVTHAASSAGTFVSSL